ncbi:mycothiol maleylpyruvate isomerase [Nocardiopsis sp. NRRL B-16309]|nr:mycothiol maleylpyruvate isomerase [Nocardiopsis sp. NRRL B-16309]
MRAESAALEGVLSGLSEAEAVLPSRCAPWDVAALSVHTVGALLRVGLMLEEAPPGPGVGLVSAAGYYAPDVRFSPEVNGERVRSALVAAERRADAGEPGRVLRERWRPLLARLASEEGGRVVVTRHGDPMRLTDFLVTRVVEALVHGLDLADALGREPWCSREGLGVVTGLVFGGADMVAVEAVLPGAADGGAGSVAAVRAVTGRGGPVVDRDALVAAGVWWPALG